MIYCKPQFVSFVIFLIFFFFTKIYYNIFFLKVFLQSLKLPFNLSELRKVLTQICAEKNRKLKKHKAEEIQDLPTQSVRSSSQDTESPTDTHYQSEIQHPGKKIRLFLSDSSDSE